MDKTVVYKNLAKQEVVFRDGKRFVKKTFKVKKVSIGDTYDQEKAKAEALAAA